jgi:hypothetical protein
MALLKMAINLLSSLTLTSLTYSVTNLLVYYDNLIANWFLLPSIANCCNLVVYCDRIPVNCDRMLAYRCKPDLLL